MLKSVQDAQKIGRENFDQAAKSFAACTNGLQTLAADMADYAKKSFEASASTLEKLMGAKSFDKAMQIQSEHLRIAYEHLVAHSTKVGEVVTDVAKESCKPFEGMLAKVGGK